MKVDYRRGLCAVLASILLLGQAHAQEERYRDSTKKELDSLLASKDPADRQKFEARLRSLAASDRETDMSIAGSYYFQLKDHKMADSIDIAEIKKFPKGPEARIRTQQAITRIKSQPEMEKAYYRFIKDFPPDSYPRLPFGQDRLPYDRIRIDLADQYAKEKKVAKAKYYAGLLEADFWKGKAYSMLAGTFHDNGDLQNASFYQQRAVAGMRPFAEGKLGGSAAANFAASGYAEACGTYAQLLYEQKNYKRALKYIGIAVTSAKTPTPVFNYTYAKILTALHRNREAYQRIEAAVRSGQASAEMSELFKILYVKVKGSSAGLDAYQEDIRKGVLDDLHRRLTKSRMDQPAPDFTLTDLHGKEVTLSSLKGKVVILDFWATWCVPCKASFPAMQAAQDKFKNDPDVQFLFIHTWERSPTAADDARAFLAGKNYDFEVLMDTKDPETRANKVVDSYNVTGIPTKFVIDKEGNIRFRLTGFTGSKEEAVDEISMMIDMVRGKS